MGVIVSTDDFLRKMAGSDSRISGKVSLILIALAREVIVVVLFVCHLGFLEITEN